MKNAARNAVCIIAGFVVLWYVGAMFNFFPFLADDLAIRAVGFTGLLIVAVIVICTCWIITKLEEKNHGK
ncbi:hypothetical protein [Lawsonibacter celer]|uniref:hypothetical protein n=1 Tax=Lawsonibacter celer TaxID=2986526 RepID=UPI001649339B|nr:hypothetical protein [Lawsonibacter celer]